MGKFAQFVRLNVSGSVRVELEREDLVAGEFLRGVAYVDVSRPVVADALVVVVTGKEKTSWQSRNNNGPQQHKRSHSFFTQQIVLATLPPQYEPGNYVYPFQYQLPSTLPGVTAIASNNDHIGRMRFATAEITYTLEVRLRANGLFGADLSAKSQLLVLAAPPYESERAIEGAISDPVRLLALFSKGTCDITAVVVRRVLARGDVAVVNPRIYNNSRQRLDTVVLELEQRLELTGASDHTHIVVSHKEPGVDVGASFARPLHLFIPDSLPPSCTTATLFSLRYVLRVKCRYFGCPGPRLDFPISVVARAPVGRDPLVQEQLPYIPLAIPADAS